MVNRRPIVVNGSVIVGHQTRESFMRATGRNWVCCPGDPAPIPDGIPASVANAGLRAAFAERRPERPAEDMRAEDLRAEGLGRMERSRERVMRAGAGGGQ